MSMYRQLWLALILSTLLALAGSLLASTMNSRAYLQEQLRMKNADNASALALSLSQKNADAVEVELAAAALFDSGHYESIRVVDPAGKLIVERVKTAGDQDAPAWFMNAFPVSAPPGAAQISNGWKQLGTVVLVSNNNFAYRMLWKSTLQMIGALLFAGAVGGYLGTLILRRLKRPLDTVTTQARDISERRFVIVPEPKVPELRTLSSAMNSMVIRLKSMLEDEAKRVEALRREATQDPLTGLANREHFMGQLRSFVNAEDSPKSGLLLVRVAHLADINRRLGRGVTDELLRAIGKTIDKFGGRFPGGFAARLNGADFGLLLPGIALRDQQAEELLQELLSTSAAYMQDANNLPIIFIGTSSFSFGTDVSVLLAQVDGALAEAEASGVNTVRHAKLIDHAPAARNAEQWTQLIQGALERRQVKLAAFPVMNFANQLIHQECPLRLQLGDELEWSPAGRFMPVAERQELTARIDLAAISLGLKELALHSDLPGLAINVSAASLKDKRFLSELRALMHAHASGVNRLCLEFSEHAALAHFELFSEFCRALGSSGCKIGLEHFGRQFSQIGWLHGLGLHYLKIDASFIRDIHINPGNRQFLKGVTGIAHNMDMLVFAEGVTNHEERQALAPLGFDGVTGPGITAAT
jgi:diguanylate cyclase (GGDEF)-like protein